ncbi:oxidoreductase [Variovorax sp. GT1P44]|uniref:oxidoreductase n=1 Tax=Variovorax sp. GT1P44 TaxID=3443742 RepID=UPI003F4640C2
MVAIASLTNTTANVVMDAIERAQDSGHRPHLGASLIGHSCERHLWLAFRWAKAQRFEGRMLRLFEIGRRAELRFVEELRAAGILVHDVDERGSQFRVSDEDCGHHFGGSMDGAAQGLPEAPKAWHVCEFKTHNDKSFRDLRAKGVQKAKPMHYAQMQVYMGLTGMDRALYYAENKNDAALHVERVHFDKAEFERLRARALRVIKAAEPPIRISNDPAWFECKFCHFHQLCHGTEAPEVSCRTCAHSTAEVDGNGRWTCARHEADIDVPRQRAACSDHRVIPILLERIGTVVDATDEAVTYRMADGQTFVNGDPEKNVAHLSSEEIHAAEDKRALAIGGDTAIEVLRATWGARVVA